MYIKSKATKEKPLRTIDEILNLNPKIKSLDLTKGIILNKKKNDKKLRLCLQLAKINEAEEINQIYKEVYHGTYPYKQLEDTSEVQNMIKDPNFYWLLFKLNQNEIIGCAGFHINTEKKTGTLHGLAIKREYHGSLNNLLKLCTTGLYKMFEIYSKKIFLWYCEVRSAHTKSQYMGRFTGFFPIAFLPKKDLFFNCEESEFLYIIYNSEALKRLRCRETPQFPKEVLRGYFYSFKNLNLNLPIIKNYPNLKFDKNKLNTIRKNLTKRIETDKFGNELTKISIKNQKSYIKFLYNPFIQTFEQTDFRVNNKEELFVFIEEIKKLLNNSNIRYCEFYISAYNPVYHTILLNAGFESFGYIPSFKYNSNKKVFEDYILFVYYKGIMKFTNLKLLPETRALIKTLKPQWNV